MRFFRQAKVFGPWLVGAVGAGTVGTLAVFYSQRKVHCSTNWDEGRPYAGNKWDYNWDKREPYSIVRKQASQKKRSSGENVTETEESYQDLLEKRKCKAIRHIFLIRHGQYNLKGSGDCEQKLTDLGLRQATQTGKRIESLGITFDSLTCSTMTRAIQTAELIQKELTIGNIKKLTKDPLLNEGVPASPEPPVTDWQHDLSDAFIDGSRIEAAFRKYFHRADPRQTTDSYEIIVCHGNVIRYFICRALQFPGEAWLRMSLKHTSITCLSILPSGRVVLRSAGDSGHLPPDMCTVS